MIDKSTQKQIRNGYIALPCNERTDYVHNMAAKHRVSNYTIRVIVDGEEPGGWKPKNAKGAVI